ncbi:MAG: hypothetical protein GDA55_02990 [Cellvibrionales bacterium]|nr:hypothetical protein [Cellvibrionales bacterium]
MKDPVVEEIHRYRQAHARKYGNDLRRIVASFKKMEKQYSAVTLEPKPRSMGAKSTSRRS